MRPARLAALRRLFGGGLGIEDVAELDEPVFPGRAPVAGVANRHQAPSGIAGSIDRSTTRATNIPERRRWPCRSPPTSSHTGGRLERNEGNARDVAGFGWEVRPP